MIRNNKDIFHIILIYNDLISNLRGEKKYERSLEKF